MSTFDLNEDFQPGSYFQPDFQCLSADDVFDMPIPAQMQPHVSAEQIQACATNVAGTCSDSQETQTHNDDARPFCAAQTDSLTSTCLAPATRRGSVGSVAWEDMESGSNGVSAQELIESLQWHDDTWINPTFQIQSMASSDALSTFEADTSNYFCDLTSSSDSSQESDAPASNPPTDTTSAVLLSTSATIGVEPLSIEVQHTMRAGEEGGRKCAGERGGTRPQKKHRCRTNKKPLYWTAEDHKKFVAGLEQFGLQDGLGPSGAELMSVYMGNRSVLQIKSHMQKHLSDQASGRTSSSASSSSSLSRAASSDSLLGSLSRVNSSDSVAVSQPLYY